MQFKKNESPFELASEWASIIDALLPLSSQLDEAFTRGRITVEGVKKTMPKFVGVFAAVATAQQDNFKEFAKKVEMQSS